MDPSCNPDAHASSLEEQCNAWLLCIEQDLHDSSLTFEAVQWALSTLQATQRPETSELLLDLNTHDETLHTIAHTTNAQGDHGDGKGKGKVPDEETRLANKDITLYDMVNARVHVAEGDLDVGLHGRKGKGKVSDEEANLVYRISRYDMASQGKQDDGSHGKEKFLDEETHLAQQNRLCELGKADEHVTLGSGQEGDGSHGKGTLIDERTELAQHVRLCDTGKAGNHVATIINYRLDRCSSLVNLIEHCLLVSLDQDKPSHLKQIESEQVWLHAWLFNSIFSSTRQGISYKTLRDSDWLLAYLSATYPNLFFVLLLDVVAADLAHHTAGGIVVPLSTLVRMAFILEYVYLRYGEHAAFIFLSSSQVLMEPLSASKETYALSLYKPLASHGSCLVGLWLIMGFLCPGLFSCCINLLASTSDIASIHKWWHKFQYWDSQALPLSDLSRFLLGTDSKKFQGLKDWLCVILRRRLALLSTAASDIVLVLSHLCDGSSCQKNLEIVQTAHSLLEVISSELCQSMLQRVSGLSVAGVNDNVSMFLENLRHHIMNLWNGVLEKGFTFERLMEGADLYEHPAIHICFSTTLCCHAHSIAKTLVYSTGMIYSCGEEATSTYRLGLLFRAMQILAGTAESQLIFKLWAENLVDRMRTLPADQAYIRALAVLNLLKLSSGKDSISGFSAALWEPDPKMWVPVCYHLSRALNTQWLCLHSLLHWDEAWDLRLIVLSLLQLLSPDKFSNNQEVICRLKGALGLFFWWLDKAYGYKQNEESYTCMLTNWNESDEKWQFVQLIEKLKVVIIQLASSKQMSFTLMINSILDYSFHAVQDSLSEATSRIVKAPPSLRKSGRLNRYGRLVVQPLQDSGSHAKTNINGSNHIRTFNRPAGSTFNRPVEVKRSDSFPGSYFIGAQLENLLRQTVAVISRHQEQSVGKSDVSFQLHAVLAKLLMDRLQTPHEVPVTKDQYEEAFPKTIASSRHVFLMDCFSKNPLFFEILEIIIEKGGEHGAVQCLEFLRALLAHSITYWQRSYYIHKSHNNASLQVRDEEADRVQVCRLIQMISRTGWVPKPLASSSEIVSVIEREDMSELLLLIWHCLHQRQESKSKPTSALQASLHDADEEDDANKEWEDRYYYILRKNVAHIGPHFSHVYPKLSV